MRMPLIAHPTLRRGGLLGIKAAKVAASVIYEALPMAAGRPKLRARSSAPIYSAGHRLLWKDYK